jgi:AcrR family transcriptional regulator
VSRKRKYEKRRRAELEAQTRLRITESAVELHGSIGPARTSMSALAEHAGVTRSTLYRHFPDEAAVLAACSAHWTAENPPPDPAGWAALADPEARLQAALRDLYAYYGRTCRMLANLHRDEAAVPALGASLAAFREGYLGAVAEVLLAGRPERGRARRLLRAAIGHVLTFPAWRSLVEEQGLGARDAVALAAELVAGAARA